METTGEGNARDEGLRLLKAGQLSDAIAALAKAIEEGPEDAQAHMYLGIACHQAGEGPRAAHHLEQSVQIEANARAYFNLALVYESAGRTDEAKAQYRRALMLDSNYANARQALDKLEAVGSGPVPVDVGAVGQPWLNQTQAVPAPPTPNQTQVVAPPPPGPGYPQPPSPYGTPPGPPASGPQPYIYRQIEEQRKIQEAHRTLMVNGVVYGAICGAVIFVLLGMAGMFLPVLAFLPGIGLMNIIVNGLAGVIFGGLVGFWMGYTAGDETQAAIAGAVLRGAFNLVGALLIGLPGFLIFAYALMGAISGAVVGHIIGRLVDCSTGQI